MKKLHLVEPSKLQQVESLKVDMIKRQHLEEFVNIQLLEELLEMPHIKYLMKMR